MCSRTQKNPSCVLYENSKGIQNTVKSKFLYTLVYNLLKKVVRMDITTMSKVCVENKKFQTVTKVTTLKGHSK